MRVHEVSRVDCGRSTPAHSLLSRLAARWRRMTSRLAMRRRRRRSHWPLFGAEQVGERHQVVLLEKGSGPGAGPVGAGRQAQWRCGRGRVGDQRRGGGGRMQRRCLDRPLGRVPVSVRAD